jgi:trans-aconitate methyltransferase
MGRSGPQDPTDSISPMVSAPSSRDSSDDWESHWEEYAASAERNPAQSFRRRLVEHALGELDHRARLVDIGCGQGDLLRDLHQRYPTAALLGVEQSASGLAEAARKAPDARLVRRDLLVDETVPPDLVGWATHATCAEVLEHVDEPVELLENARAYLAPGCRVVVTVPGGPMSAYDRHIGHRRHYDAGALRDVLERAGYLDVTVQRAGFPAFNLYKAMVIARGRRLIDDAKETSDGGESKVARAVMAAFRPLFHLTLRDFPLGWQLVAAARPRT